MRYTCYYIQPNVELYYLMMIENEILIIPISTATIVAIKSVAGWVMLTQKRRNGMKMKQPIITLIITHTFPDNNFRILKHIQFEFKNTKKQLVQQKYFIENEIHFCP